MNATNTILGCPVTLKLKSNEIYQGIFVAFSPEFDIILEMCHKLDINNQVIIFGKSFPKKTDLKRKKFNRDDVVEMSAFEVDRDFVSKSAESNFTDASIAQKSASGTCTLQNILNNTNGNKIDETTSKELEPFNFEDDQDDIDINDLTKINKKDDGDLNNNNVIEKKNSNDDNITITSSSYEQTIITTSTRGGGGGGGGNIELHTLDNASGWCAEQMLITNEQKFGYKSTFNSEMTEYTIAVEKADTEEYWQREREAQKMANEIESSASYLKNVDKELSDGDDEEEKFSAVIRTETSSNSTSTSINQQQFNSKDNYKHEKQQQNRRSFNKNQQQQQQQQQQHLQQRTLSSGNNQIPMNQQTKQQQQQRGYQQQQQQPSSTSSSQNIKDNRFNTINNSTSSSISNNLTGNLTFTNRSNIFTKLFKVFRKFSRILKVFGNF
jgi:small nuclear ribonucleoprotein (snRNP)-like protein